MLQHAKSSLEESGLIAAHPVKFHKLVTVVLVAAIDKDIEGNSKDAPAKLNSDKVAVDEEAYSE